MNHYKFTALERDSESGLDHTWFRQYSSGYGRWLTPDPLGGSIFDPQSLNRYTYVGNSPCNWVDPLGPSPPCTINVAIGGVGGAAIQSEIQALFAQAGVGVNFNTTPQAADFSLSFVDSNALPKDSKLRPIAGAGGQTSGNVGWVWVNKVVTQLIVEGHGSVGLTTPFAAIGAHEIAHFLGLPNIEPEKGKEVADNLMGPGTHLGPQDRTLTGGPNGQRAQLLRGCQNLRTGRAGGGGGGGGGSRTDFFGGGGTGSLFCDIVVLVSDEGGFGDVIFIPCGGRGGGGYGGGLGGGPKL